MAIATLAIATVSLGGTISLRTQMVWIILQKNTLETLALRTEKDKSSDC